MVANYVLPFCTFSFNVISTVISECDHLYFHRSLSKSFVILIAFWVVWVMLWGFCFMWLGSCTFLLFQSLASLTLKVILRGLVIPRIAWPLKIVGWLEVMVCTVLTGHSLPIFFHFNGCLGWWILPPRYAFWRGLNFLEVTLLISLPLTLGITFGRTSWSH